MYLYFEQGCPNFCTKLYFEHQLCLNHLKCRKHRGQFCQTSKDTQKWDKENMQDAWGWMHVELLHTNYHLKHLITLIKTIKKAKLKFTLCTHTRRNNSSWSISLNGASLCNMGGSLITWQHLWEFCACVSKISAHVRCVYRASVALFNLVFDSTCSSVWCSDCMMSTRISGGK